MNGKQMDRLNPLIGSLIVLGFLLLTFAGCNTTRELTPAQVLEKANAAASSEEVTSFHFTLSFAVTAEGMGEISVMEAEGGYLAPDRIWTRQTRGIDVSESITIGNKIFVRDSESSPWRVREGPGIESSLARGLALYLENFVSAPDESVIQLDDEDIDGVESWRFRVNQSKTIDSAVERMEGETDPETKEMLKEQIEYFRTSELAESSEIWIGKDDYLLRKIKSTQIRKAVGYVEFGFPNVEIPEGTRYTITVTYNFSDFNEPVEIEVPTMVED